MNIKDIGNKLNIRLLVLFIVIDVLINKFILNMLPVLPITLIYVLYIVINIPEYREKIYANSDIGLAILGFLGLGYYMSMLDYMIVLVAVYGLTFYIANKYLSYRPGYHYVPISPIFSNEIDDNISLDKSFEELIAVNKELVKQLEIQEYANLIYDRLHNQAKSVMDLNKFYLVGDTQEFDVNIKSDVLLELAKQLPNINKIIKTNMKYICDMAIDHINKKIEALFADKNIKHVIKLVNATDDLYNTDYSLKLTLILSDIETHNKLNWTPVVTDNIDLKCDICQTNKKDTVFNCGHIYCCACVKSMKTSECPYCRIPITTRQHVFI
jgi:hypothetical protein